MKKRIFKFGAALTAALMMFSATASLAFAEGDVVDNNADASVTDTVEAPKPTAMPEDVEAPEEDVKAPAEDTDAPVPTEAPVDSEEVNVPLDTAPVTEGDVNLESKIDDVDTGSVVKIGNISASKDDANGYYNVNVPFTIASGTEVPSQMTFFVYDITSITGDQNNTVGFTSTTPVGYINQFDGQASGTYSFKLSQTDYNDDSIIIVKIGGTGVSTPDAKSYSLKTAPGVVYGDVNMDTDINAGDAILVMQYAAGKTELSDDQKTAADVSGTDGINSGDAILIMQYAAGKITNFPVEQ